MATLSVSDTITPSEYLEVFVAEGKLKLKSSPNNFGGLRTDGNRVAMTGAIANFIQSVDVTTSPVTSPLTNVTTQTLTVPQNATQIIINPTVVTLVGEDSSYTYGVNIPANTLTTLDCANQQYVYIKPSNTTNTINFIFKCV